MSSSFLRFPRATLILLATMFLAPSFGLAGGPQKVSDAPHFSMKPKALYAAASEVTPKDGTDVAVLDEEEVLTFDANGRYVHNSYMVYKVLTQKGVQGWDDISTSWQTWREDRPIIKARVITPDYAVHELDPKTITDAPESEEDSSIYSDERVVRAPLPAIAPGSVVEQELVLGVNPEFAGGGATGSLYFGRVSVPVQHRKVVIDAPSALQVQYALQQLPDLQPQRTEANGQVKIVFEAGPIPAQEEADDFLPTGTLGYPVVLYSVGTSWQRVAEEYARIVEGPLDASAVKSLVAKLIKGQATKEAREQALVEYLDKEIRYTGIEFGENTVIPHSTAETLTRKYGDCKDKALLLVAMLRAAKIPAYMALLNVTGQVGALPDLPGVGIFDHAIVFVPGEPDQWIDATDAHARLAQLPMGDQGRMALVIKDGTQTLVRTPEDPSQTNVLLELREFHLAEYGPARVVETTRPQGAFESGYRDSYVDRQNEKTRENLTKYVKSQYLTDKLDRWDRSDPADLSHPFELVLESDKAKRGFTDLESAVAAVRLDGLFYELPGELQKREEPEEKPSDSTKPKKKRTVDYQLPRAFVAEWQYKIVPPLGFRPGPLPRDQKITLGPALLTEQFSADNDGVVHADIRFDSVKRRLSVAEATELRNKVAEVEASEAIMIRFQLLGRMLQAQGKMRESFQSYRDLIAQHPKEAVHHLQISQALLDAGMGEAARDEARLAVKLEPNSAAAEKTLANILEYDLVGRKLRSGSDYAGAAEAFRAAAKLDPDDKAIVGNLAILLEYNQDGLRYGPGAKMPEAVAEYRKLSREDLADLGLQNNLAYALFYAGQFAEARQNAQTLNPQPKALAVVCEAALNGSAAGIAEANKLSSGDADLKQIAKTAGEMLMKTRQYSLAADLLQAGATGDNAAQTIGLATVLRKVKRHEEIQLANDPQDLVKKASLLVTDPDLTMEKLASIGSRNGVIVLNKSDSEEKEDTLKLGKQLRQQLARQDLSWDLALDLGLQLSQPKGEGNDAVGYREKLQTPGGKQTTFFVVKEEGEYKLLDTADKPNAIGLEILDRVAANNLDGARALLDWLREEQHLAGGDDPLLGIAFPRFWTKGKDADARQMKLAAAAILVETKPTASQGLSMLEEARKAATSDAEKTNITVALLEGYAVLDDYAKLLSVSSELAKQYPESARVFRDQVGALEGLGKFDEADALIQQRLKRLPDDVDTIKVMERNDISRGDYQGAYKVAQSLVDVGKVDASDLNGMAWLTLFFPRPDGPDIDSALKSSQLSPNSPHILHTLSCLYAESGKTKEAYDVLIHAMDIANLDEPNGDYWFALGRIAEQYGEREIALADYAKVTKPKRALAIPESSYQLAQNRLKVLQGATSGGK